MLFTRNLSALSFLYLPYQLWLVLIFLVCSNIGKNFWAIYTEFFTCRSMTSFDDVLLPHDVIFYYCSHEAERKKTNQCLSKVPTCRCRLWDPSSININFTQSKLEVSSLGYRLDTLLPKTCSFGSRLHSSNKFVLRFACSSMCSTNWFKVVHRANNFIHFL